MPIPTSTALPKPLVLGRETQKSPTAPRSTSLIEVDCDIHTVAGAQRTLSPCSNPSHRRAADQSAQIQPGAAITEMRRRALETPDPRHNIHASRRLNLRRDSLTDENPIQPFRPHNNSVAVLTVTTSTDQSGSPLSAIRITSLFPET